MSRYRGTTLLLALVLVLVGLCLRAAGVVTAAVDTTALASSADVATEELTWVDLGQVLPNGTAINAITSTPGGLIIGGSAISPLGLFAYDPSNGGLHQTGISGGVGVFVPRDASSVYLGTLAQSGQGHLWRYVPSVNSLNDLGQINAEYAHGLTVGQDGKVYVSACCNGALSIYDPATNTWNYRGRILTNYIRLSALATAADGVIYGTTSRIWISPSGGAALYKYDPSTGVATVLHTISAGTRESWNLHYNPLDQRLYGTVSYQMVPRLFVYDPRHPELAIQDLGAVGTTSGDLLPGEMSIAPDGRVYVKSGGTLYRYDPRYPGDGLVLVSSGVNGRFVIGADGYLYRMVDRRLLRSSISLLPVYTVSGQVFDPDGAPFNGVSVCITGGACAMTDSSGEFSIGNLASGNYTLTATKFGYTFSPPTYSVTVPPDASNVYFTSQLPPAITGISPASGPIGAVVSIAGYGLSGATSVTFDGSNAATFTVVSPTQIDATVPAGTTTGPVTVTTPAGVVTSTASFTVKNCPAGLAQHALVLIPGWGSANALASDVNGFQKLIEPLEAAGYYEGCNLFYVGTTSPELNLHENGRNVRRVLCNAYPTVEDVLDQWDGTFDLIGHSYGGLRSREYLETELYNNGYNNCPGKSYSAKVRNLFTLGTPHGGGGTVPGALKIALPNWVNENTRQSADALWPSKMKTYNQSHYQPEVCYRLIGGDVSDSERELPAAVRAIYFLAGQKGILTHHDLGVYTASSLLLGDDEWRERYPRVLTYETVDIHGYFGEWGLGDYRSYVSPSPWETLNLLRPMIGASVDSCRAGGGGGSWSVQPLTEAADEPEDLILEVIATGVIDPGTTQEGTFAVVDGGQAGVLLEWPLGTLELTLTDPTGAVLDASIGNSNPSVQYFAATTLGQFEGFVFTDMATGDWSYEIAWVEGNVAEPIPFALYRLPEEPISLAVVASPEVQANGEPVQVTAALRHNATTAVTGAQVEARVTGPSGLPETIQLFDDGSHGDGGADDGDYGAPFSPTAEGGQYHVEVEASGNYQDQPFRRNGVGHFVVLSAANAITGVVAERAIDADGDGDYDQLATDVAITIGDTSDYRVSADLVTQAGQPVAHAATVSSFDSGQQTVTLTFDGRDIATSLQSGPYVITNLMLLRTADNTLQAEWNTGHTTAPYQYWEFDLPPLVSGFAPATGAAGSVVSITGAGFTAATEVLFGGQVVEEFTVALDTRIDARVPVEAITGLITVVTPDGRADSSESFVVLPAITSFQPASGPAGTPVTITGSAFSGATAVTFNDNNAASFTVNSATQITAVVPAGATMGKIAVTTPGGTATSAADFTVIPPPTIGGFSPTSGPTGTPVTITGSAFTGATAVTVNGVNATSFTVDSATQITVVVPAGATTGKIAVMTPGGTATSAADFTVTTAPNFPDVFYISPSANVTVGSIAAQGADVLRYTKSTNSWTMVFDGSNHGLTRNVSAFTFLDDGSLLFVLVANQTIAGLGAATPYDVIKFTPNTPGVYPLGAGTLSWYFQGKPKGLTTTGEKIDAIDVVGGRLLLSIAGGGSVPTQGGGVLKPADEDVFVWDMTANVFEAALLIDGSKMTGMAAEDINGVWDDPQSGDYYVTILGAFNLGGIKGNDKSLVKLSPNGGASVYTPSLVSWLAAGATLPTAFKIDGLEMAR